MSTYSSLHYHITFSTKNRAPLIHQSWEARLHEYLGGIAKQLNGFPQGVGGIEDHVHLLIGLKPNHCISNFMRELKRSASEWVHSTIGQRKFKWQEGYAIFSVSATARTKVKAYISNQREHHRTKSFQEELLEFLERAGIEYDPKYFT